MTRVCTVFRSLHVMLATACVAAAALPALADGGKARDARAGEASRRLPLAFEANKGQADTRVKFLARGARNTLFLTDTEAVLSLAGREGSPADFLRMTFPAATRTPASAASASCRARRITSSAKTQPPGTSASRAMARFGTSGSIAVWISSFTAATSVSSSTTSSSIPASILA